MTNEIETFSYEQLDDSTAEFLRNKEIRMREIVGKAYTDLGRELKEAQDRLSKHGYGCFGDWCESLGFCRKHVYRRINRYNAIANAEDSNIASIIENLPVSLGYEITKPSAESSDSKRKAKEAVLNGEIKTLKQYRNLEMSLRKEKDKRSGINSSINILRRIIGNQVRCSCCGIDCTPIVQWHHIRPISLGGDNRTNNVTPLCPNCHSLIHRAFSNGNSEKELHLWISKVYHTQAVERLLHLILFTIDPDKAALEKGDFISPYINPKKDDAA